MNIVGIALVSLQSHGIMQFAMFPVNEYSRWILAWDIAISHGSSEIPEELSRNCPNISWNTSSDSLKQMESSEAIRMVKRLVPVF